MYFDLEETEAFYSLVEAFRTYLRRNKLISDVQRTSYINFIRYAKKLFGIRSAGKKIPLVLKKQMEATKQLGERSWLLKKAE